MKIIVGIGVLIIVTTTLPVLADRMNDVIFIGTDAAVDTAAVAILTVNATPNQRRSFYCYVQGVFPQRGEGAKDLPRTTTHIVVKPGKYQVNAALQHSVKEVLMWREFKFAAGQQYIVDCMGKTPGSTKINVTKR
ncbi:MAG: hypothetical protein KF800_07070 [Lysobacter sp.]|nr:hypothetical protein [Lysobacter sp.]